MITSFAVCMLVAAIAFFLDSAKIKAEINFTALGFGFCALAVLFLTNSFK